MRSASAQAARNVVSTFYFDIYLHLLWRIRKQGVINLLNYFE
jgi:hypothetical protein